jgi:pSer/pThr/pTyr-binding forkhead associated (FHA) protein
MSRKYSLIVLDGPDMGATHVLQPGVTMIGRLSSADSFDPQGFLRWELSDKTVSRTHCEIAFSDAGAPILAHLSMTNKTFVNGEEITDCFLEDGQLIAIGQTKLGVMVD